jgi:ABC-type transporter Mla subunit MlaD
MDALQKNSAEMVEKLGASLVGQMERQMADLVARLDTSLRELTENIANKGEKQFSSGIDELLATMKGGLGSSTADLRQTLETFSRTLPDMQQAITTMVERMQSEASQAKESAQREREILAGQMANAASQMETVSAKTGEAVSKILENLERTQGDLMSTQGKISGDLAEKTRSVMDSTFDKFRNEISSVLGGLTQLKDDLNGLITDSQRFISEKKAVDAQILPVLRTLESSANSLDSASRAIASATSGLGAVATQLNDSPKQFALALSDTHQTLVAQKQIISEQLTNWHALADHFSATSKETTEHATAAISNVFDQLHKVTEGISGSLSQNISELSEAVEELGAGLKSR